MQPDLRNLNNKTMKYHEHEHLDDDSIRLLELHAPAYTDSRIVNISLTTTKLAEAPPYEALSYTWGSPVKEVQETQIFTTVARCFPIHCHSGPIIGTQNLRDALIRLHLFKGMEDAASRLRAFHEQNQCSAFSRYICIDASCINQEDVQERGKEVALMGSIYCRANWVVGWIGEADQQAKIAMRAMHSLAKVFYQRQANARTSYISITDPETWKHFGIAPITQNDWIAFMPIVSRSWFERGWILQEMILA